MARKSKKVDNTGRYFGYRDKDGSWRTWQYSPNPMTPEQESLVATWESSYGKLFSRNWFKAVGNDILFAVGLKNS